MIIFVFFYIIISLHGLVFPSTPLFIRSYNHLPQTKQPYTKDVIIFVHGLLDSSETFIDWAQRINKELNNSSDTSKCLLLGVDCPGHGQSPKLQPLDYILSATKLMETLQYLFNSTTPRLHLIGHSTGGKLVSSFALQYPNITKSIVLIDVLPIKFPSTSWIPINNSLHRISLIPIHEIDNRKGISSYLEEIRMPVKLRKLLLNNLGFCFETKKFKWNFDIEEIINSSKLIQNFPDLSLFDYHTFLGKVLLLRADKKKSFYAQDKNMDCFKELFPNSSIKYFPNCGHWLHAESPNESASAVASFLSDVITSDLY
jgi:pimeloyl-ACP methyl ester carboxylesterase